MVIISDNIHENFEHMILMDDGYGHMVHIPSIFISEEDGNDLI